MTEDGRLNINRVRRDFTFGYLQKYSIKTLVYDTIIQKYIWFELYLK